MNEVTMDTMNEVTMDTNGFGNQGYEKPCVY